jgi:4-hydroxy-2-oxoheptanedioate aldolase
LKPRSSRVLKKLRAGQLAGSVKINLSDARSAEIAAMSGIDCVWLDMEHVPNTLRDIENQIRAAKIYDVDAIVRVPRGSYSDLIRPLEMDAAGIMVPHVMSADDARNIVRQTRFHPIGRRPVDAGNADAGYCAVPFDQHVHHANTEKLLVIQIEDPEPLDELDEIARVDGIDMLFFGPADFAQGIGRLGELDIPEVHRARRLVAEVARRHGRYAGTTGTLEEVPRYTELGYQFLNVGADVVALGSYFQRSAHAIATARSLDAGEPSDSGGRTRHEGYGRSV